MLLTKKLVLLKNLANIRVFIRDKRKEKWAVQIEHNYKKYNLGYFDKDEEVDAAELYDINALMIFKEFANINFPDADYVREIKKLEVKYAVAATGLQHEVRID